MNKNNDILKKYEMMVEKSEDFDELKGILEDLLKSSVDFDGYSIIIKDENHEIFYQIFDDIWQEFDYIPSSLCTDALESKQGSIYNQPLKEPHYNLHIDTRGEEASALLLSHVVSESISCVLSLWKSREKEKEQVMMPLIVGSQMIGMTTRVRSKEVFKEFSKSDLKTLYTYHDLFVKLFEKMLISINEQKKSIISEVVEENVFNTPGEVIASLISMLIGVKGSIENIDESIKNIQEDIHKESKLYQQLNIVNIIISNTKKNILNSLKFTSENTIIKALSESKDVVESDVYFKELFYPFTSNACEKGINSILYIDPRLPKKISLYKRIIFTILTTIINDIIGGKNGIDDFELMANVIDSSSLEIKIKYKENDHNYREGYDIKEPPLNLVEKDDSSSTIYRKFISIGGRVDQYYSEKYSKFNISVKIPFDIVLKAPIVSKVDYSGINISILLDPDSDLMYANIMARYFLNFGLKTDQMIGIRDMNSLPSSTTHLIVFESKFNNEFFEKIRGRDLRVLVVKDGCIDEDHHNIYDFSMVDNQILKSDLCLFDLKDFLVL